MPRQKLFSRIGQSTLTDLGCLAMVVCWLTWPLATRLTTGLNSSPDSLLNAWALGWSFHTLPQDPLDLFQANIFAPRPDTLAYSEHLFGIAILIAPIFFVTGSLILANNIAILSSFWLCGVGMYLLVKELTGARWAGIIAGVILLSVPYRFQHLPQIQLLSFQWIGFALWSLARFLNGGRTRDGVALAVFVLWQVLCCNYYAVDTAVAFVIVAAALLIAGRSLLDRRRIIGLGIGAATVTACAVPFIIPYQQVRDEQGFYRRIEDVTHFSARPVDYLRPSAYNSGPHWNLLPRRYISERVLFPGFVAIGLTLAGVVLAWTHGAGRSDVPTDTRRRLVGRVLFISAVGFMLVGAVLSFGPVLQIGDTTVWSPYHSLYRHVPGFSGIRVPARHAVLVFVGCSLVAGLAVRSLQDVSRRARLVGTIVFGALLFDAQTHSTARAFPNAPPIPRVYEWLSAQPGDGAVLELPIHDAETITEESRRMYYSTRHFKPLVNGFSGWWPNDYWELVGRLRHFPTAPSLRFLLERAPVEHLVIHYDQFDDVRRRHLLAAMERYSERLPIRVRFGNDVVYRVARPSDTKE